MPLVSLSLPFVSRCKDHSVWTDRLYTMSSLMTLIWIILLAIQQDKRVCFGEGCRSWMDIDLRGERIALVLLIINLFIQLWYIAIMPAERNAHIPVPVLHSGENTGMSGKTVSLMENPGAAESNRRSLIEMTLCRPQRSDRYKLTGRGLQLRMVISRSIFTIILKNKQYI